MTDRTYETEARRALIRAADSSNPQHKIGDALVAIGYAVLHLAAQQEKGRTDGNSE